MMHCPKCHSPHIVSNKIEGEYLERATQFAQATQAIGIKRVTVLAGLGAVVLRAIDALMKDCRCQSCGHTFDAGPGHELGAA
ncbi:hypothetical protein [Sphingobium cupriresistens]|uniref:Uncharacterized protein n=1 Tax=Sphingobium cupriresistens TaxID=1132417 RepID=A0A8G2DUW2_9SPHN|nr:hypothetical protein [Sphingobium cupriresistens]RYM05718.1 hypothetical protein EWH12_20965 [Sphingobium cupriresistens]